jgi:hypothetical protein
MMKAFQQLFKRDLNKLKEEIRSYNYEQNIWKIDGKIANTAGNLCLHLVGNLNTYIGKELGGTDYVRNRDLEFSQKNVSQKELIQKVEQTIEVVDQSLAKLTDTVLEEEYPLKVYETKSTTGFMLGSLLAHLGYHLGQINYHRRILDK